jgi:tetratricopeptide (TPR) repeat protein
MTDDVKNNQIVPSGSRSLSKVSASLVRRGLDDLAKATRKKGHVLLVNDQDAIGEMEQILAADAYEVRATSNGDEAVELGKSFEPQVVMLGLHFPVALGGKLFNLPSRPRIVLWGDVGTSQNLEGRREFYNFDLLSFPLNIENLLKSMTRWVATEWNNKAIGLAGKGHYLEALPFCEKALEIDPLLHGGWINRGDILSGLSRWPEAMTSYDRAIEIDPSDESPWIYKGYMLDEAGQVNEAILCFDSALKISPNSPGAWIGRGRTLQGLDRHEEAIRSFDTVFEIDHSTWTRFSKEFSQSGAWTGKGVSLHAMGRYEEAINCYEKAVILTPYLPISWYYEGIAQEALGRINEALDSYEKYLAGSRHEPDTQRKQAQERIQALKSRLIDN